MRFSEALFSMPIKIVTSADRICREASRRSMPFRAGLADRRKSARGGSARHDPTWTAWSYDMDSERDRIVLCRGETTLLVRSHAKPAEKSGMLNVAM